MAISNQTQYYFICISIIVYTVVNAPNIWSMLLNNLHYTSDTVAVYACSILVSKQEPVNIPRHWVDSHTHSGDADIAIVPLDITTQ